MEVTGVGRGWRHFFGRGRMELRGLSEPANEVGANKAIDPTASRSPGSASRPSPAHPRSISAPPLSQTNVANWPLSASHPPPPFSLLPPPPLHPPPHPPPPALLLTTFPSPSLLPSLLPLSFSDSHALRCRCRTVCKAKWFLCVGLGPG